jgi:hypothetical protein
MRGALLHRMILPITRSGLEINKADECDRGDGACGKTSLLNVFTRG